MKISHPLVKWLLEGDISIQYQTHRDLLNSEPKLLSSLKKQISTHGWAKTYLSIQNPNGYWGKSFYQPKWTSTHYTLLELRNLCIQPTDSILKELNHILDKHRGNDGGINPSGNISQSDICINGMFLNYACYFGIKEDKIRPIVDLILNLHMKDGGYNCRINRSGATHSSVHSTICVLEGIRTYEETGYTYRLSELLDQEHDGQKFLLIHHLYKSDHTGEIIHKGMTTMSYPHRWKYNFLRALDYFRRTDLPYDERLSDALSLLISKRKKDGTWSLQAKHPGKVYFTMEQGGKPSRWNTLLALRVLNHYANDFQTTIDL